MSVLLRLIMVFMKDDKFYRLYFLRVSIMIELPYWNASLNGCEIE